MACESREGGDSGGQEEKKKDILPTKAQTRHDLYFCPFQDLAVAQADLAIEAVSQLAPSRARDALQHLAYKVGNPRNAHHSNRACLREQA